MTSSRLKFSTLHLVALVTAISIVCAIAQLNVFAAMMVCPLMLGPTIAHAISPTYSAIWTGALSSVYWTLFLTLPFNPLIFWPFTGYAYVPILSPWLITIPIVSSMIGGYLGARLAKH